MAKVLVEPCRPRRNPFRLMRATPSKLIHGGGGLANKIDGRQGRGKRKSWLGLKMRLDLGAAPVLRGQVQCSSNSRRS